MICRRALNKRSDKPLLPRWVPHTSRLASYGAGTLYRSASLEMICPGTGSRTVTSRPALGLPRTCQHGRADDWRAGLVTGVDGRRAARPSWAIAASHSSRGSAIRAAIGCTLRRRASAKCKRIMSGSFALGKARRRPQSASIISAQRPSLLSSRLAKGATKVPRPCRVMIRPRSRSSFMERRTVW